LPNYQRWRPHLRRICNKPGFLVHSWTSTDTTNYAKCLNDRSISGIPLRDVYTFNSDNTMVETDTNEAGKTATSRGSYSYTGDQVTVNFSSGAQEQATVTWVNPDQIHYKITKNPDISQVGMDIVRTRQSETAAQTQQLPTDPGSGPNPPTGPTGSALNVDVISQAYLDNPIRADPEYNGKVLTIVGKIDDITTTLGPEVDLYSNVEYQGVGGDALPHMFPYHILCTLLQENENQLAPLNKGDMVTIQGTCEGQGGTTGIITFRDCRIVSKP